MSDWLMWNYQLWRNARKIENSRREYYRKIKQARAEGQSEQQIEEIKAQEYYHFLVAREERLKLISVHLTRKATKLLIPVQFENDEQKGWAQAATGGYHLTPAAIHELHSAIRNEERERSEVLQLQVAPILSIAAAFTGLLGVLIGLFAWLAK